MSKSLLSKKIDSTENREALSTESEIRNKVGEENKQKTQAIQKKHRERYLADWKSEKKKIDGMRSYELASYIRESLDSAFDPRVGLHSMKINPHEHAIIKLALEKSGARSSRELFVKYCKEIIKE
ncbi:TPA: hypothetical protein ACGVAY_004619 [Vibrio vulnificus]|uniref:hypothetical protein n=1 Tax=Vibrio vulnificus TaxID=672 RepID=UPI001FAEC8FA|nr:hypothetical protein [Vibrio vulnificus]MCJ0806916.1 hypothetical protein [Vibrio vulnificus]